MRQRAFLGIDCGTQSTKALLLDAESGAELAIGRAEHELISRPDGTREQDPRWWTVAAITAVRRVLAAAPLVQVSAIGVSGQQHGLVVLDREDQPLRPAKLWNDTTTAAECVRLTDRMGGTEVVHAATGNVFLAGYTAPKVEWLRAHEPDAYRRAVRFCLPHDYMNLWLTGEYVTESGDASGTAYFDVRIRRYADSVLATLDPDRDWLATLPPVRPSLSVIGHLRADAADLLGLEPGTPVSAGGGDNMCAAIGIGAVAPGPIVVSLGTSGTAFGYAAAPAIDPLREVSAFCDSSGGWLPLACTLNCTRPLEWARRLLGVDQEGFDRLVLRTSPGARGLAFVPYMDGERTPDRPDASGQLLGLRSHHGPGEVARAVIEGVTAGLAYALNALARTGVAAESVLLVGGGAQSMLWGQLCADWFQVAVSRPEVGEAAARGAALQAASAAIGAGFPASPVNDVVWLPRRDSEFTDVARRYREMLDGLSSSPNSVQEVTA